VTAIALQNVVVAASSPRESHFAEVSAKLPSERITPPSEPAMNWNGLPGTVTSACWSGCMPSAWFGSPSWVMSVNVAPPSVERMTARPFVGPCCWP